MDIVGFIVGMYIEYCFGPSGHIGCILHILDCLGQDMQVLYLGRAPRTKETLPDFLKWHRVTRPPLVFRGLTGSQRTPGFWGVTAWYQSIGIRIPRELGFGYPSPQGGMVWSIGLWKTYG